MRTPPSVWTNPWHFIAFGFGSGCLYPAPGTWGTLMGLFIYLFIQDLPLSVYSVITIFVAVFGVWLCDKSSKDIGVHDHGGMVWDEISGILITLWMAPQGLGWLVLGFLLFRFFDILKPWPISWADKHVTGGLGVMLDDWLAAIPAFVILQACAWIWL